MIIAALTDALISTIAERGVSAVLGLRDDASEVSIELDHKVAAKCLKDHLRRVGRWSSEISFRDLLRSKSLAETFVDLECYVGQGVFDEKTPPHEAPRLVTSLLNGGQHVVILGRPGAGKTTSLQRLALTVLQRHSESKTPTPVVIRLRDLSATDSLLTKLAAITGIRVKTKGDGQMWPPHVTEALRRALSAYFDAIDALLFVDGLDETSPHLRRSVERDLDDLMEHASSYRVVLTCRKADYAFAFRAQEYTLLPLTIPQIRTFANKWLGPDKADEFINQLTSSPFRGAEAVPITIAHLCAIFERRGEIPRQPRFVYQKIVRLLLEEWDEQRGVRRISRYADFEIDRKLELLRQIAYALTIEGNRGGFTHKQLEQAYLLSHASFGLPREEYSRVAREIESHSGLILQSADDRYEFAHKSIQEFLSAEYLLRLPSIPHKHFLDLPDEMALATALSSRAELYLESVANVLFSLDEREQKSRFAIIYLNRLAVERPNFPIQSRVGWALLAVWNVAFNGFAHQNAAKLLLDLAGGHESPSPVRRALENSYQITDRNNRDLLIRPVSFVDTSAAVDAFISEQRLSSLPIPIELFKTIRNERPEDHNGDAIKPT